MPLTNNASFIPAMDEFIAHWTQVNAALTPDLVVGLPNQEPVTLATFTALRTTLLGHYQTLTGFLTDKEIARGDIRLRKAALLARFNEFNALLDGYWAGTPYLNARAYAPNLSDGQETFLKPLRDAASLWEKLNQAPAPAGITLPLALADATLVAGFRAQIDGLQAAYATEANANQNAVLARATRDAAKALVKAVLLAYRTVVPARCAQHPTLVATLPALTPTPGHTPAPVNASAVFQAPDAAKIVHDASPEATLARYELRGNPGDAYSEDDAVVIATHTPAEPREFLTTFGLTQPGAAVALKVFTLLTTGNEAGSAAMVVERPD